jgi:hypothetical protein
MSIEEGNKLIAEFMGYKYFEANVHDTNGGRMDNVYSKVPIEIEEYDECKFFKELPNPDYKKDKPEKWNPDFGLLSWQTLNHDQFLYGVLQYHTSWDWLMPVVEKIENSKHSNYGEKIKFFVFSMAQFHCSIIGHTGIRQPGCYYQTPYGYEPPSKIMAVWEAVIGFIQWYNSNNTNQINSK